MAKKTEKDLQLEKLHKELKALDLACKKACLNTKKAAKQAVKKYAAALKKANKKVIEAKKEYKRIARLDEDHIYKVERSFEKIEEALYDKKHKLKVKIKDVELSEKREKFFSKLRKDRVVYKKVYLVTPGANYDFTKHVILKMQLPEKARMIVSNSILTNSYTSKKKLRVSQAKVIEVLNTKGETVKLKKNEKLRSIYDSFYYYEVGKIAKPLKPLNKDNSEDCGSGIHCYRTFKEAVAH